MEEMEIRWDVVEKELIDFWTQTIRQFAFEHPDVKVYYAGIAFSMQSGKVYASFDDLGYNVRAEQVLLEWAIEQRGERMNRPDAWKSIRYALSSPRIDGVQSNHAEFRFSEYAVHQFSAARLIRAYHDLYFEDSGMNEYVPGNLGLVAWKACLALHNAGVFHELRRTNPFYLGYAIDGNSVNLHIARD